MLQPGRYPETVSAAGAGPYKHGRRLSGFYSSVWLGAGPYGVGRQHYSLVHISRQSQQLALAFINTGARCRVSAVVFGWALGRTESGTNAKAWYYFEIVSAAGASLYECGCQLSSQIQYQ